MANELQRHDSGGFLKSLDRFIQDSGLQDVKTRMDSERNCYHNWQSRWNTVHYNRSEK